MKKISIMILVLVAAMASCKKTPEVNLKYVDVERDLVTVGMTIANIQCDYDYIATLKKAYLYYGEGEDETNMTSAEMRVVQNTLYVELSDLKSNTTYSYYYEFHNGFNSMRTALKTFKTETGNGGGEEPPMPEITLPTVITALVTGITSNSAQCGGEVVNDGGAEVTERGICWSTNENPTLEDNHNAVGTGTGVFTVEIDGLQTNTTYHVRAYATNEAGTAYGLDKEFTTLSGGESGIPEGAINGLFTINENGDQVYFSQGNLQYKASTNTWRFAENQWDFVGGIDFRTNEECGNVYENDVKCDNSLKSSTYSGWIDLFGWGTSGYDHGAVAFQPWATSPTHSHYYAYGSEIYNLYDQTGKADWGYNAISNGGNAENLGWRTLTVNECNYLFFRNTSSGICYAKGLVNDVCGVILLPDSWSTTFYALNDANGGNYNSNVISTDEWENFFEANGAVFLPAGGWFTQDGFLITHNVVSVGFVGDYWYSSFYSGPHAYSLSFNSEHLNPLCDFPRSVGKCVRLVLDANL